MLNAEQIDDAAVFLAELLMEAVCSQAKKQSHKMIVNYNERNEELPSDALMKIDYEITVPVTTIKAAIEKAT